MDLPRPLPGHILDGPLFSERVRVETAEANASGGWMLGLVGLVSERFRTVTLSPADLARLTIIAPGRSFDGDARLLRLGLQAYALGIAWEFDPFFGLSISRVDPLPHQLEAVYDHLLKLARVRFLLADDAGAGKTIMSGLLIRELQLRGLAERILIVCPANLAFQWQRELKEKFDSQFVVMKGGDIREQFGVNQWHEQKRVITSLDLAKRTEILAGLKQVRWDLVIVDEAHRMSASDAAHKSQRYRLGELLRDSSDHLLLLTATPHQGDPENFSLFLQLLDADAYADVTSIRQAMAERRAPFYLRRTKEAMVHFPERQADGGWTAVPIFTKRIPHTVAFAIDGAEYALYDEVTRFVKHQSRRAAAAGDDPRARAVGFLMSLYQRRLASSTFALRRSLEKRARRLEEGLGRAEERVRLAAIAPPDPEDLEEMEEGERERIEEALEAATLAATGPEVRAEIAELGRLAGEARALEGAGGEAKLARLEALLVEQGFFTDPARRLLIFTEFRDTLEYLVAKLKSWGFRTGVIHGGMKPGAREEPGTRLHAEQQFREGAIQVLVATEAAGEGINLQVCNVLFNYDIPWNPNRLEQRMGRIHRYGQRQDCLIFNFVAANTVEGRILRRLLERLTEIRNALDDDAVFNVVGEVLTPAHVERILRDYYAGHLGDGDLEERLLRNVDERHFRAICQNALEGLATKNLNLGMLIERRAQARERRLVPETIARFLTEAAPVVPLALKAAGPPHSFAGVRTPAALFAYQREADWKLPALADRYPSWTTDRETASKQDFEWVTPGHPLFEAMRRHVRAKAEDALAKGATFSSLQHASPARVDFYRARIVDGLDEVIRERLFAIEIAADGAPRLAEPGLLGDFQPAAPPPTAPAVAALPEATDFLHAQALAPLLAEVRHDREAEITRIHDHVERSLAALLERADDEIGRAGQEVEKKIPGAEGRLAVAESRHAELMARRQRRRGELERRQALTVQAVQRLASVLILPHPERDAPEVRHLRPDRETEAIAMREAMDYERAAGREPADVSADNLGYDIKSLDHSSGDLRLIEVKGIGGATGTVLLTPNERRVAEDRRDCYWLYVVTHCDSVPRLEEPARDPASLAWQEVQKVAHYSLSVSALSRADRR
ncbi:MAG: helicase-related protein [Acetobacteraceae bacterium]